MTQSSRQPFKKHRPMIGSAPIVGGEYRSLGGAVKDTAAGERVDGYLARGFPFFSRAQWQKRLSEKALLVNGQPVKAARQLREGDRIELYHPIFHEPEVDKGIRVLSEQGGVMAVFKPGNLPMHENGPYRKHTFAALLADLVGPEWAAVHRLDRETSGIVICAASLSLRSKLSEAWASRLVAKEYLAIVNGVIPEDTWEVDAPIGDLEESQIRIKKWVVPGGLTAQTSFTTLARSSAHSLIRARPRTGRTNQIRIHAAWSGWPLVGDKLYHPDEAVFLEYFAHGNTEAVQERTGFKRLCLHAAGITLRHPESGAEFAVECPLPEDLSGLWAAKLQSDEQLTDPELESDHGRFHQSQAPGGHFC